MFLLFVSGVDFFDSLSHSLTCLSTGGYSTYDASIEHFRIIGHTNYILIEYIIILGMFLGGTNFFIHYHIINKNFKILKENTEFKYWVSIILIFISIIFLERIITKNIFNTVSIFSFDFFKILEQNFRIICFQTVSLLTTTGFGTKDINLVYFGSAAKQLFLVMMLIGGCVGSTGGGFKVLRIAILHKLIKRETNKMFYPRNSINYVIVDEQKVSYDEIYRIAGLLFIWILFLIIGGLITAYFSEYDPITCVSGMFSALGNIGPCYIPVNELGNLHPVIKITYILGMLAGRLEILPVLLFFRLKVWKK
jgi:trk system potassium uptake protein TrkH